MALLAVLSLAAGVFFLLNCARGEYDGSIEMWILSIALIVLSVVLIVLDAATVLMKG